MLAGIALLLVLCVVLSFRVFRQIEQAAAARQEVLALLKRADDLLSALKDAENGQRGFSLTGDETFLEPYLAVHGAVGGQLRELRQLTRLRAAQIHLAAVAPLMEAKLAELAAVIELRRQNDLPAVIAKVRMGEGKRLMDLIRIEMSG